MSLDSASVVSSRRGPEPERMPLPFSKCRIWSVSLLPFHGESRSRSADLLSSELCHSGHSGGSEVISFPGNIG
jgi:hypothetical protein